MKEAVELVGSTVLTVQKIFGMLMLTGIAIAAILAFTINSTAPVVAEKVGERAENMAEKQMSDAVAERAAAVCARLQAESDAAWDRAVNEGPDSSAHLEVEDIDRKIAANC